MIKVEELRKSLITSKGKIEGLDYAKLGFKCGLEIHQQLNVGKLFCGCDFDEDDLVIGKVARELTVSKGETGDIDAAASFEKLKELEIRYSVGKNSSCLVELDEEPPHEVNPRALYAAYQLSMLFDMTIVDMIQFMRKIVIDGSNTTGFQRTALVAMNGRIKTSLGAINLATMCLEEDACKIESKDGSQVKYDLSRLGVPLIELATQPNIKNPEHAKETAETIGLLLRSSEFVKRGLGTIRQDLNVSIENGARVEIKGAQDLENIPNLLRNEVIRQLNLAKVRDYLIKNVDRSLLKLEIVDLSHCFSNSGSKVIKSALSKRGRVLGIRLPGFSGVLGLELNPNRRVGTEVADYAKQVSGVKGLFHSDELPGYGIAVDEVQRVKKELSCSKDDAFIMIADIEKKAKLALKAAFNRVSALFDNIPKEVRQANPDGTTKFLRPMPGSARMYPETDVPYIIPNLSSVKKPKLITEKVKKLVKLGLDENSGKQIIREGYYDFFLQAVSNFKGLKPSFIYSVIISKIKELRRMHPDFNYNLLDEEFFSNLLSNLNEKRISKQSVDDILLKKGLGKPVDFEKYEVLSAHKIEEFVKKIRDRNSKLNFKQAMGEVMKELRGKADGKTIAKIVRKYFK